MESNQNNWLDNLKVGDAVSMTCNGKRYCAAFRVTDIFADKLVVGSGSHFDRKGLRVCNGNIYNLVESSQEENLGLEHIEAVNEFYAVIEEGNYWNLPTEVLRHMIELCKSITPQ